MAEDASAWKQRYELALEAIERTARDNREFTQELVRGLNRLTLASEGQDHELDIELRELRAFLRMKALSREVLSSKLDVLEERLRELSRRDRNIDPRLESAITTLLDQVDTGKQPRETQRASQLLRKELRALDPLDALLRAVALRADVRPGEKHDTPPASAGILERWFGARATEAAPAKAAPVANSEPPRTEAQPSPPSGTGPQDQPDPASSFLDDGSKKILVELLEMLEPPESSARLHANYSAIRQRLDRSVRLGSWVISSRRYCFLRGARSNRAARNSRSSSSN